MIERALAVLAIVALAVSPAGADDKLKVPNLVGKSVEDAQDTANKSGFPRDLDKQRAGPDCKGTVTELGKVRCQSPAPGTLLGRYESITVFVNMPHEPKEWDYDDTAKLIGLTVAQAKKQLADDGFKGKIEVQESSMDGCKPGTLCDIQPRAFGEDASITFLARSNKKLEIKGPD